jgi:SAM-dependent methyltransferase
MLMHNPPSTEAFVYTGKDELEQQKNLRHYNRYIARMFSRVMAPGQTLLDFGAGIGTIATLVEEQVKPAKIVCVELDAENAAFLRSKGFGVCAEAKDCPPGTIDAIYSSNVLEHVEDEVATLRDLRACLKEGGRGAFWVPAFQCLWTPFDERVGHFRRYRRPALERVFKEAGFQVEKCLYQDSVGFFVALLFRMIASPDGSVNPRSFWIYDRFVFPLSRICDSFCSPFFGKNLLIYVRK